MLSKSYKEFKDKFLPLINEMSVMSSTDIHFTMGGSSAGSDYTKTITFLGLLEKEGKITYESCEDFSLDYFLIRSVNSEEEH